MKRPLCYLCLKRPARPHPVIGWYLRCDKCRDRKRKNNKTNRSPLCHCGSAKVPTDHYCSAACRRTSVKARWMAQKMFVLEALGNQCSCTESTCPAHNGSCSITQQALLTVEHTKKDGHRIRGGMNTSSCIWSRYKRALSFKGHGMILLCFNCHMWSEFMHRTKIK
jgi:hypothetical protein